MILLAFVCTLAVGLGLLRMPFGYYTLLRIVLCLAGAVGIAAARRRDSYVWLWVYGALAVLYNPILPLKLGNKGLWIGLNIISLGCLWVGAFRFRGTMTKTS
jgi:hypothetical protein